MRSLLRPCSCSPRQSRTSYWSPPPLLPALLAPPTDSHAYAQDCIPLRDIEYVVLVSQAPVQMIQSPLGETAADLAGGSEGHTAQQPEQLKRGNSSVPEERESAGSLPRAGSAKPRLRQMSQETSRAARASARAAPELPSGEVARSFNIVTSENGYNGGRIYSLRVETEDECKEWVEKLRAAVKSDKRAAASTAMGTGLPRLRRQARLWYNSTLSQSLFALVIVASFITSCIEAEIHTDQARGDNLRDRVFSGLELAFAVAFAVELAFNMFGSWMRPFLSSSWNLFDALVVLISFISLASQDLPGVNLVRLFGNNFIVYSFNSF